MSQVKASKSPRAKAHKLKIISRGGKEVKSSPNKKNKFVHESLLSDEEEIDYEESPYDVYDSYANNLVNGAGQRFDSKVNNHNSSPFPPNRQYFDHSMEYQALIAKFDQTIEENDMLQDKLKSTMEEKFALEQKIVTLTDKLIEAKRGLQETSFALQKVQQVTSQLMSKKDEREQQLQESLVQNNALQRKLSELERQKQEVEESRKANAKEMEIQLAVYRGREQQWQSEREVEKQRDREREMKKAKEREEERLRELEREQKRAKEKEKEAERMKEMERELFKVKETEKELKRELERMKEKEKEMEKLREREMEKVKLLEMERDRDREKSLQLSLASASENNNNSRTDTSSFEEQLVSSREQITFLKRENCRLLEEKADALYVIEAKNTRINLLEERLSAADARAFLDWNSMSSRDSMSASGMRGMGRPSSSSDANGKAVSAVSAALENKVVLLETDKSLLEQRLAVLERQLNHPVIQAAAQMAPSIMNHVAAAQPHFQSDHQQLQHQQFIASPQMQFTESQLSSYPQSPLGIPPINAFSQFSLSNSFSDISLQQPMPNVAMHLLTRSSSPSAKNSKMKKLPPVIEHEYALASAQEEFAQITAAPMETAPTREEVVPSIKTAEVPVPQEHPSHAQQFSQQSQQLAEPPSDQLQSSLESLPQQYRQQEEQLAVLSYMTSTSQDQQEQVQKELQAVQSAKEITSSQDQRQELPHAGIQHDSTDQQHRQQNQKPVENPSEYTLQQQPAQTFIEDKQQQADSYRPSDHIEEKETFPSVDYDVPPKVISIPSVLPVTSETKEEPLIVIAKRPESRPDSSAMTLGRDQSAFFHEATSESLDMETDDGNIGNSQDSEIDAKRKLEIEKRAAKKTIMQWYKAFVKENNREPTKMERDIYVGEVYKQYRRSSRMMKDIDTVK
eukprot:gene4000-4375_t